MFEQERMAFLDGGRLAADGVPFSDLSAVRSAVGAGERWYDAWVARSSAYEVLTDADHEQSGVSRGDWLWLAAMTAHAAQLYWFEDESEKRSAESRRSELYRRAAPLLLPPALPVHFEMPGRSPTAGDAHDSSVEGYLRRPVGESHHPSSCAILLGGLDSTKEESRLFEDLLLARGVATFTFDGPGQGETARRVPLGSSFTQWVSAAISALEGVESVDADRIGLVGRSLGGSYALAAAASEGRVKACLAWSPVVSGASFGRMPPGVRRTFCYACGDVSEEEAEQVISNLIDTAREAARIKCPTLVCHGGRDHIVPTVDQVALSEAASHAVVSTVYPEGRHCCHNIAPTVRPRLADWVSSQLRAPYDE